MLLLYISIFLTLIYACLIIFYRINWFKINDFTIKYDGKVKITVIIPARNEQMNIGQCLDSICSQSYNRELFEVIIIDDFSTDGTAKIIESYKDRNVTCLSLEKLIGVNKINSYKKKAIELAIGNAKGDLIVTTDADCIVPRRWLETISSFYEQYSPAFICAPVAFHTTKKFLSIFQALDFMTLQGITGAAVNNKFHSMCNGANLAYEKKVFYDVGGFQGIDDLASGDDMLLMNKIAAAYPDRIMYLKSKQSIVHTNPMDTIGSFLNQRIRWASKSTIYSDKKIIAVLAVVYVFNVWLLILAILSLFNPALLILFITLLVSKTVIELFFLFPVAVFFDQVKQLWWFPMAQPFHIIYTIIAGWLGKFGSYKWKDRLVK